MTRINKAISMLGICSRREADRKINSKTVFLNNQLVDKVGTIVNNRDIIIIDNITYIFQEKIESKLWLYYKPTGLVTSHNDEKNRKTVFDDLEKKINQRVISIGRLDINSQGLLLLTNDGEFAQYVQNPQTKWLRHYMVRVFGAISPNIIQQLEQKMNINGIVYKPMIIHSIQNTKSKNCWIDCAIKEGKNREIRNIFQHFNLQVNRLIRYKYGPYELDDMHSGEVRQAKFY